ncbi:hypothetical protein GO755_30590 [Spirosoma sp. HMF4905]|uniref:Uncharacterized protein n=1 Tax=Spirosoma arboris TaxID=2682092 RepID=A0A7K1SKT3_9BACT|nr:hypothetical protein [Spirosoma arboris]MVM34419.1 hypothetical protein [Spirosoma arboris]
METIREKLQKLLVANEQIMDNQPSDDLYLEWAELAKAVSDLMNGFVKVLDSAEACRDLQKSYFKSRKLGHTYDASKLLDDSKKAEKALDDLIKHWSNQITPPLQGSQISLFE